MHAYNADTPGMPQNVQALTSSRSEDSCVIYLQWGEPLDGEISKYTVDFNSGSQMIDMQSTAISLTVQNCDLNVTVKISAVDICGRRGPWKDFILEDVHVLQDESHTTNPSNEIHVPTPAPPGTTATAFTP